MMVTSLPGWRTAAWSISTGSGGSGSIAFHVVQDLLLEDQHRVGVFQRGPEHARRHPRSWPGPAP